MANSGDKAGSGRGRALRRAAAGLLLLFSLPALASAASYLRRERAHWSTARSDSAGIAPDAASTPEAVVQVYAARAWGWRGAMGAHTWIAVKPAGAAAYTRYEVIGWRLRYGGSALSIRDGIADAYWYGSRPELLVDLRGDGVDRVIAKLDAAARAYPYAHRYNVWPGPNSNTFTAYVGRRVPELRLDLPPTAVGKDYLTDGAIVGPSPSGTGYQFSLFGVLGLLVGWEEGVELNLLGLTVGVDVTRPALKLPGLGRVGAR